jgi:hypothetical protein
MQKNLHEESQIIFEKASFGDFKKNKEPYLLQVISIINSVTHSENSNDIINVDMPYKQKAINQAVKVLNLAIENNHEDLSLYYYRGLLMFYLHKFFDAFLDFDYIVEKEDEPLCKYYLARGK